MVFYYAGLIESWGSGTIKMINLCKENHLPDPDFINYEEGIGAFSVVFYKDIYTEEILRKMGLNERQMRALLYVKERGKISNREYQNLNSTSRQTATRDLSNLVERQILIPLGEERGL